VRQDLKHPLTKVEGRTFVYAVRMLRQPAGRLGVPAVQPGTKWCTSVSLSDAAGISAQYMLVMHLQEVLLCLNTSSLLALPGLAESTVCSGACSTCFA
jgi:hypothetical protein